MHFRHVGDPSRNGPWRAPVSVLLFADLYLQPDQGSGARHAVIRPCGVGVGNGDPRDL